jgi:hypothetical protein
MPSNNNKYTPEFREKTVKYILDRNISATQMAGGNRNRYEYDLSVDEGLPKEKHLAQLCGNEGDRESGTLIKS